MLSTAAEGVELEANGSDVFTGDAKVGAKFNNWIGQSSAYYVNFMAEELQGGDEVGRVLNHVLFVNLANLNDLTPGGL